MGPDFQIAEYDFKDNFTLEARAYNDGVAFRIILPGKQGEMRVPDEHTIFTLPKGSIVWYHDMYCHYEGIHQKKEISEIMQGEWAAPPGNGAITWKDRISLHYGIRFNELCRDVFAGKWQEWF